MKNLINDILVPMNKALNDATWRLGCYNESEIDWYVLPKVRNILPQPSPQQQAAYTALAATWAQQHPEGFAAVSLLAVKARLYGVTIHGWPEL